MKVHKRVFSGYDFFHLTLRFKQKVTKCFIHPVWCICKLIHEFSTSDVRQRMCVSRPTFVEIILGFIEYFDTKSMFLRSFFL